MNLHRTRTLIHEGLDEDSPEAGLIQVLEAGIELLSIPGNDFAWSSWESAEEAVSQLRGLISRIQSGDIPDQLDLALIYGPTGSLQEVSLSSGWGSVFLKVAERFDEVESKLWN